MAQSKTKEFPTLDTRLAAFAKALSHPARIAILRTLASRNACVCGEIVDVIPLAQSTVSQHLKELKEAGLITGEVEGPRVCYCLDPETAGELSAMIGTFMQCLTDAPETTKKC